MSVSTIPRRWTFACRDVGYACEWKLRAESVDEIQGRFRDHARCAHQLRELPTDLVGRVGAAAHPV